MFSFNVLKIYRKAAGISLKQLSELTYYSISYLSEVERGIAIPPIETVVKICNALHVKIALLFDDNNNVIDFKNESEISKLLKQEFREENIKELKSNLIKISTWSSKDISVLNAYITMLDQAIMRKEIIKYL